MTKEFTYKDWTVKLSDMIDYTAYWDRVRNLDENVFMVTNNGVEGYNNHIKTHFGS